VIIGLMGRVGSGKSYAQEIVKANFRVQIIDLDILGHQLLREDAIKETLISLFGEHIVEGDEISRPVLADLVFSSPEKLAQLNAVLHPKMKEYVLDYSSRSELATIIVGALIPEIGLLDHCEAVIVVDAEDEKIIAQVGQEKFNRASFQLSRAEFMDTADIIIENNFDDMFEGDVIDAFNSIIS